MILGILVLIGFVGFIFVMIKIAKARNRLTQSALQGTGLSSSEQLSHFQDALSDKFYESFLKDYPSFTKESLLVYIRTLTDSLINKTSRQEFTQELIQKALNDSSLNNFMTMNYRKSNLLHYKNNNIVISSVYDDTKDEYHLQLHGTINNSQIIITQYYIRKGVPIGF